MNQSQPKSPEIRKVMLVSTLLIAFVSSSLDSIFNSSASRDWFDIIGKPLLDGLVFSAVALVAAWLVRVVNL